MLVQNGGHHLYAKISGIVYLAYRVLPTSRIIGLLGKLMNWASEMQNIHTSIPTTTTYRSSPGA